MKRLGAVDRKGPVVSEVPSAELVDWLVGCFIL